MISGVGGYNQAFAVGMIQQPYRAQAAGDAVTTMAPSATAAISSQGRLTASAIDAFRTGGTFSVDQASMAQGAAPYFSGALTVSRAS